MKNLFIFSSPSSKPDLYLNIINYWISTIGIKNIGKITLLKIENQGLNKAISLQELKYTRRCIEKQISHLHQSTYLAWNPRLNSFTPDSPKSIQLSEEYKELYHESFSFISQKEIQCHVLLHDFLEQELDELLDNRKENYFDVTGLVNRYLVLISSYLLANQHSLSSIEIHKRFSHDENDLLHALQPKDFTYHYLKASELVEVKLKNIPFPTSNNKINLASKFSKQKKNWLVQLSKGQTPVVLKQMLDFAIESNQDTIIKETVQQSNHLENLKQKTNQGIINDEVAIQEQRKIVIALIDLIQSIEDYLKF